MALIQNPSPATADTLMNILRYRNYPATVLPLAEGSAYQQVVVGPGAYRSGLNKIHPEKRIALSLIFVNDVMAHLNQPQAENSDMLQFHVRLPFSVQSGQAEGVQRLLMAYNAFLPLGRFEYEAAAQVVSFRYRWHLFQRDIDGLVLIEILETILYFIERLGFRIESVASGKRPVADVLRDEIQFKAS